MILFYQLLLSYRLRKTGKGRLMAQTDLTRTSAFRTQSEKNC